MPHDRHSASDSIRLPEDVAQRLLARAAELDLRNGTTSVDQLRRAAHEAGISGTAFDAALGELARGELGRDATHPVAPASSPLSRWQVSATRRRLRLAGAIVALLAVAAGTILLGRQVTPSAPVDIEVMVEPTPEPDVDLEPVPVPDVDVRAVPRPR